LLKLGLFFDHFQIWADYKELRAELQGTRPLSKHFFS